MQKHKQRKWRWEPRKKRERLELERTKNIKRAMGIDSFERRAGGRPTGRRTTIDEEAVDEKTRS